MRQRDGYRTIGMGVAAGLTVDVLAVARANHMLPGDDAAFAEASSGLGDGPVELRSGEIPGFAQQEPIDAHRNQDHWFFDRERMQYDRGSHSQPSVPEKSESVNAGHKPLTADGSMQHVERARPGEGEPALALASVGLGRRAGGMSLPSERR